MNRLKSGIEKIVEGLIVFSLLPVMLILAGLEWIEHTIFGEEWE